MWGKLTEKMPAASFYSGGIPSGGLMRRNMKRLICINVRRKFAHQGMTKRVIECIKEICRSKGVKYIRLDTGVNEEAVKKIYLDAGFKIVKVIEEYGIALYEMEV